jgi:hypothetical protein
MEKLYNNSRGEFATFQEGGYLYLSSGANKMIREKGEYGSIDIYLDKKNHRIVLELNDEGEYTLNDRICLRSVREYMHPGRHKITFTKGPEGQDWVVIAFKG